MSENNKKKSVSFFQWFYIYFIDKLGVNFSRFHERIRDVEYVIITVLGGRRCK